MIDALEQIKRAFEVEGMTPAEIAEDQDLDLAAVKSGLIQCSAIYRKECGLEIKTGEEILEDSCNFTEEQLKSVTQELYNMAMGSEDEHIRKDLLKYIRNDAKGRLNPVKNMQQNGPNIFMINNAIMQAREGARKIKSVVRENKLIEA